MAYDQALAAALKRKVHSPANSQFVQERILECYSALSDWDGLKLRLASLEVGSRARLRAKLMQSIVCVPF